MNDTYNSPDTSNSGSSGAAPLPSQGSSYQPTPTQVSGSANTVNPQSQSNGSSYQTGNEQLPPSAQQMLEQYRTQSFQKITELGQNNADLRKQLQSLQSQQEQRNLALAQALGYAPQQEQKHIIDQLVDNPSLIDEMINKRLEERMQPIQQQMQLAEAGEFIQAQNNQRANIENTLSQSFTPDMLKQVMDITSYINPQIVQLNDAINDPNSLLTYQQREEGAVKVQIALKQELERAGGYEALVDRNIGKMVRGDFGKIMQSAARVWQQNQMQQSRAGSYGGFTNGAPTLGGAGGGIQFSSESVYR